MPDPGWFGSVFPMKTALLVCVLSLPILLLFAGCGGGGGSPSPTDPTPPVPTPPGPYAPRPPPYPGPGGKPVPPPGSQFVIEPSTYPTVTYPGLVVAAPALTPRESFGVENRLDVAIDRVGYVLYGEDAGIGGYQGGDFAAILTPFEPFYPGGLFDTDPRWSQPQPILGVEHVGLARDVLGRWYACWYVPRAGATAFIVTPDMLISTP